MQIPLSPREEREGGGVFAASYLRFCKGQGRRFCAELEPWPGDGLLGPERLEIAGDPPRQPAADEIVIPRLDHLLRIMRDEIPIVMLDCRHEDTGCLCYDEETRPLANVVSRNPEEALLRALIFIRAERLNAELSAEHGS